MFSISPNTSGIYKITCAVTGKIYIGSAYNVLARWNRHKRELRNAYHCNPVLSAAWKKYGEASFTCEIVECTSREMLLEREQFWLDTLHPFGNCGYNIQQRANAYIAKAPSSDEHKRRISLAQKGRKKSPEECKRISDGKRGKPGRVQTIEERQKRSNTLMGRVFTDEWREKIGNAQRGKSRGAHSLEHKQHIADAKRGKKLSPEHIEKVAETKRKDYIATSPDGVEYFVHGLRRFCKEHGLGQTNMVQVAKGIFPHHKGWKCRYV